MRDRSILLSLAQTTTESATFGPFLSLSFSTLPSNEERVLGGAVDGIVAVAEAEAEATGTIAGAVTAIAFLLPITIMLRLRSRLKV